MLHSELAGLARALPTHTARVLAGSPSPPVPFINHLQHKRPQQHAHTRTCPQEHMHKVHSKHCTAALLSHAPLAKGLGLSAGTCTSSYPFFEVRKLPSGSPVLLLALRGLRGGTQVQLVRSGTW